MELVITGLACLIIGVFVGRATSRPRLFGNLRVDRSDPDSPPYLFLELATDVGSVISQKYVTFKVRVENFLPHE